nr:HNH endonuclease [uncultured Niameybacter sp.]
MEEHHLIPLSEGGEDSLSNVFALCPNCHREMHFGQRKELLKTMLR